MASITRTARIAVTTEGLCSFCNKAPERPLMQVIDGKIANCCVGNAHDAHVVRPSNHATFVARARKAGITGEW